MNCEKIQNRIDELIFDHGVNPVKEIKTHLESCTTCSNYYNESLKTMQFMQEIKDKDPVLDHPDELIDSIMQSITQDEQVNKKQILSYRLIIRLLAAAVIALLVTLGIEQYIVLNKMLILETELGKAQLPNSIDRTRIYKASLMDIDLLTRDLDQGISLNKIRALMRYKKAKQFNFTFYDIRRYMIKDHLFITDLPNQIKNGKD